MDHHPRQLDQEIILRHYRNPHHKQHLVTKTAEGEAVNLVCGDEVRVELRVEDEVILQAAFNGQGCSISQAAASMLMDLLPGKTLLEVDALGESFRNMLEGKVHADPMLGELRAFQSMNTHPARIPCATLGFRALSKAMRRHRLGPLH